jgi:hypothetical protein
MAPEGATEPRESGWLLCCWALITRRLAHPKRLRHRDFSEPRFAALAVKTLLEPGQLHRERDLPKSVCNTWIMPLNCKDEP